MSRPLISATLIARNEAHNVERCFDSIWQHVDQVVLVDTGSVDGTVEKARAYAKTHGPARKLKVGRFKWVDDFAAARNAADDLATGLWLFWMDMDDTVVGLENLRQIAKDAQPDEVAFFTHYTYAQDEHGNIISELWRERLVRAGVARWEGRLHEHKIFRAGRVIQLPYETARWVHHRAIHDQSSGVRNLRILKAWDVEEPDNPRIVQSLGLEYLGGNDWENAIPTFQRYLTFGGEPPERRAQASRYLSQALMQANRVADAESVAFASLRETWGWTDTHLSLAECAQTLGRPQEGLDHALRALGMGKPQSILILNPLQYTAHPRALAAVCEMQLGHYDQAMRYVNECLEVCPSYPLITAYLPGWQQGILLEQTVQAWLACADLLVKHGEHAKAKELLDTVPFFAARDQRVIGKRTELWLTPDLVLEPLPADSAARKFIERHLELAA
jgi:tetratricopeptide (TPR) repeat protein